eukprot:RCo009415
MVVRYRTDFEKQVLLTNFELRRWSRTTDEDWNLFWASVTSVRQLFSAEGGIRLSETQIVNHFPNHFELTRKDLMSRNIKRYRRDCEKDSSRAYLTADGESIVDFVPMTYSLPLDFNIFLEEYKRDPGSLWIIKPSARSQGKGIFIVTKLGQIKKWAKEKWQAADTPSKEQFVISKYVEQPLLIGGKKFDLRLYVLVTCFRPLRAYLHSEGFARFCSVNYNTDAGDLDNLFVHLTNVAVQKRGEDYNDKHGGKWHWNNLRLYVESTAGFDVAQRLFGLIKFVVVQSLRAVVPVISNVPHCFELYGYDMLVDSSFRPWLLEVNASPSLSDSTVADRLMKTEVLSDALDIVLPPEFPAPTAPLYRDHRVARLSSLPLGGFTVLVDDAGAPSSDL